MHQRRIVGNLRLCFGQFASRQTRLVLSIRAYVEYSLAPINIGTWPRVLDNDRLFIASIPRLKAIVGTA